MSLSSLILRLLEGGEKKELGRLHTVHMCLITPTFQGSGYFLCMSVYSNVTDGYVTNHPYFACPGQAVSEH